MKFMKLGSKPDTFYTAEAVRSVSSEVSSDIIIQVKGNRYLLHKFPLLSKCALLQKLCSESLYDPSSPPHPTSIHLPDFPGGAESFELCAKFCYGITITLSAHNIVAARCAAEYLQMTEDTEKGNLIHKLEVFLTSCVLQGWKDAIVALQSTKSFSVWAEDLGITGRCIDAVATKVLSRPSKVSLSHSYSRRGGGREDGGLPCRDNCNGGDEKGTKQGRGGWWAEDLAELGIDLYWRTMIGIKSGGRVPSGLIGEALQIYAFRWFPTKQRRMMGGDGGGGGGEGNCNDNSNSSEEKSAANKHRLLLESIVSLLPAEKGAVPCSFLLKLLKAANMLGASSSSKMELARRVGIQLEEATLKDLLIPSSISSSSSASKFSSHQNGSVGDNPSTATKYDVDVVMSALEQFMAQGQQSSPPTSPPIGLKGRYERRRRSRSAENIDVEFQESRRSSSASHGAKFKVARLVDGYLREIASDPNLPLAKMIAIAECVPDFARVDHDDLYRAVDTYLKAHPDLNKSERKRLCRILDCGRLSMEACMHAAQNELLPLRVVVQVLFFEQARATKAAGGKVADLPPNIKAIIGGRRGEEELDSLSSSRTGVAAPPPLSSATTTIAEDQWSVSGKIRAASPLIKSKSKVPPTLKMKLQDEDEMAAAGEDLDGLGKAASKLKNLCSMPAGPKRMFCRLLSVNRSASERR